MSNLPAHFALLLLIAACLQTGCRPADEIRTYRVAKSASPEQAAEEPRPENNPPTGDPTDRMIGGIFRGPSQAWFFKAAGPLKSIDASADVIRELLASVRFDGDEPSWDLPEGWTTGNPRPMRLATIVIPSAESETELSVIGLPLVDDWESQVLDNVNRWRGQLKLDPLTAAELGDATSAIEGVGVDAVLFDDIGWLDTGGMTPPFAAAPPRPTPPRPAPPAELIDQVPTGWTEQPGSAMRKASYVTPGDAEVTAFAFPAAGQMSDELANVNRWRREVGLSPTGADELRESRETIGIFDTEEGSFFQLAGEEETTYAAMVVQGDQVWFFKLRGPTDAADAQRDAFREWLSSLRLSN